MKAKETQTAEYYKDQVIEEFLLKEEKRKSRNAKQNSKFS